MDLTDSPDYLAFGQAYGRGDLAGAAEALERCLTDPKLVLTPELRSNIYRRLAWIAFDAGDPERMTESLAKAESVAPHSSLNNYFLAGFYLTELSQPREALRRAEKAAAALESEEEEEGRDRWQELIRALRGHCLAELGRIDEAASELEHLRDLADPVTDHAVELCEALMNSAEHRILATRHLGALADRLRRTEEPERIAIADRIDEILAE